MAHKTQLRQQRTGTIINLASSKQEGRLGEALFIVEKQLRKNFDVTLLHERNWKLSSIVGKLRKVFPKIDFCYHFDKSTMRPDGGILSILNKNGDAFPILIVEVKNQGTNDLREAEGKIAPI